MEVYNTPLLDLVFHAAKVHRMYNDPQMVGFGLGGCSLEAYTIGDTSFSFSSEWSVCIGFTLLRCAAFSRLGRGVCAMQLALECSTQQHEHDTACCCAYTLLDIAPSTYPPTAVPLLSPSPLSPQLAILLYLLRTLPPLLPLSSISSVPLFTLLIAPPTPHLHQPLTCTHPQVQRCTLLSIKTGGCPETCNYCSQSSSWSKVGAH